MWTLPLHWPHAPCLIPNLRRVPQLAVPRPHPCAIAHVGDVEHLAALDKGDPGVHHLLFGGGVGPSIWQEQVA